MDAIWAITAFGAAALWGLNYLAMERVLKTMQTPQLILVTYGATLLVASIFLLLAPTAAPSFAEKISLVSKPWLIAAILTHILAVVCIVSSIKKAASHLAAIVEVSYPIFTVFFAWMLLGRNDIDPSFFIGGGMIMAGVMIVGYFNEF